MLICDNQRVFRRRFCAERYFTGGSEIKCRKILNFIWRIGDKYLPLRRLFGLGSSGPGELIRYAGSSPAPGATQGCVNVFL